MQLHEILEYIIAELSHKGIKIGNSIAQSGSNILTRGHAINAIQ